MSETPHTSFQGKKGYNSFEYNVYSNNMVEVVYYNRLTKNRKIFHIYFEEILDLKLLEEAFELTKKLYESVKSGVAKPNIPLYALIMVLNKSISGFSYKCKIKKTGCPVKIYHVVNGMEVLSNTASLMEQMYRIFKKYPPRQSSTHPNVE